MRRGGSRGRARRRAALLSLNDDIDVGGFVPRDAPCKFEAGTPAIEATIGFGAAVKWMRAIGMTAIREHDLAMSEYLIAGLADIKGGAEAPARAAHRPGDLRGGRLGDDPGERRARAL